MNRNLEIVWQPHFLNDIFDIESAVNQVDKINIITTGAKKYPYITRSGINNGVSDLIPKQNIPPNSSNVITIGLDTQTVFYQQHAFYTGQNIQILKSPQLNQFTALFFIPIIKKQIVKFNWGGNGATLSRLKRLQILIPTIDGEPDWGYIQEKSRLTYSNIDFNINKITSLNDITDFRSLADVKWNTFELSQLFDLYTGKSKGLNHFDKNGSIPYLGATNRNNGILAFVKDDASTYVQKGNCIAFIRNGEGSMGYSIYKHESFIATSDITIGYNNHLNLYTGTFITTIADKIRGKYNFGYKRSAGRLKKEKLQLPIDEHGNPDWAFMEQYMKRLENKILLNNLQLASK
ncbi:restriction endonuclease subunit S [Listeria booriae]|uniref:restriction endonuclease subunit S n=1 Tax=Listeria booriae TaxID=1552123 RepID=UPI001625A3D1|nr:restriction endonuclease subunit S [Listeria booriae]MBC2327230.1 restriction endonuclease [Listeria booriae]